MRLFITGSTGFIGTALCDALHGHELLLLARRSTGVPPASVSGETHGRDARATLLKGDLFDLAACKSAIRDFKPDACIHLAWAGLPDYSLATSLKNFHA